jgi:hypothetical protein
MLSNRNKFLTAAAAFALLGFAGAANAHDGHSTIRPGVRPGVSIRIGIGRPTVYITTRHERIDRLASRLENEARELNREVETHFRSSPSYRAFAAQVDQIAHLAEHVHDVAHRGGSLAHLHEDVHQLDRAFHAAERLFDQMTRYGRVDYQTVAHVRWSLRRVETSIHNLSHELH